MGKITNIFDNSAESVVGDHFGHIIPSVL